MHGATERIYVSKEDFSTLGQFSMDFGEDIGITVCGEFDDENVFFFDHYYPYLRSQTISSNEEVSIEKKCDTDAYLGICDDMKMGISIIFYLQNPLTYVKAKKEGRFPFAQTSLSFTALASSGTILMPISQNTSSADGFLKKSKDRRTLIKEAREGDPEAFETLTKGELDIYANLSKKIRTNDLYTLVETTFMPYGVECDQYALIGEITSCRKVENHITGEKVYIMTLFVYEMEMDLCINEKDLYGEPEVGRRFKGNVWLQGRLMGDGME